MKPGEIKKIRVLLTISMLDEHSRGIRYLARELREAGMEVIFLEYRTPEEIVNSAMQEDVDVIGISFLIGGQIYIATEVTRLLKENNLAGTQLIVGGIIPGDEIPELNKMGAEVFGAGTFAIDVVNYIKGNTTNGIYGTNCRR